MKPPSSFNTIQSILFLNEEMVEKSDLWIKMVKSQQEMNKKISFDFEFKEFGYDYRHPFSGFDNLKKDILIKSQSKSETGFKKIKITKTQESR